MLTGEQFEIVIEKTENFSFAQLCETYILGAQSAFEHGREIGVADVIEAIAHSGCSLLGQLETVQQHCLLFSARVRSDAREP
jgi:hypothetical protein